MLAITVQRDWMWFIANFCIIANGAYIATAWLSGDSYLDTPKLLEHGASPITIGLYCLLTIGFGYVGFRRACISALTVPTKPDGDKLQTVDEIGYGRPLLTALPTPPRMSPRIRRIKRIALINHRVRQDDESRMIDSLKSLALEPLNPCASVVQSRMGDRTHDFSFT